MSKPSIFASLKERNESMDFQKVSFKNKELDLNLAGILYTPDDLDVSKSYPAVVVTGPMLSIKEQAQSVYAKRLAELQMIFGFETLGGKVAPQPLRRILVPCGTRNLVKMLPHGKMQMCINDLHIDLFSMQYLFMLSV